MSQTYNIHKRSKSNKNMVVPLADKISLGWVDNAYSVDKFGLNDDIDIGTEDIISIGGTLAEFAAAVTLTITPAHADETDVTGDGMRTMKIDGLDANYEYQTLTVALTGVTPVVTTGTTWIFVHRLSGVTFGDNGTNTGAIVVKPTAGTDHIQIDAAEGQSLSAAYMVPAEHSALLYEYWVDIESAPASSGIIFKVLNKIFGGGYVTKRYHFLQDAASREWQSRGAHTKFPAKSIVKLTATSDVANSKIKAGFNLLVYPDP